MIIVIEGLSLTGKTTICKQLYQHYVEKGMKCKLCFHGHLYNDEIAQKYYQKAIMAYNEWSIQDAFHWPGGKFCVSVFRQNQEYHIINVHDWGLFPLATAFPGGWDGMRAGTA